MRHELPLPRRPSSVQNLDTTISPRRPLSSSFFASIDPLVPARHSSLNLYPQYVFPSKLNKLNSSLEVPYAFSHQRAAFYWTRDNALANHKLNIWAKPPCLNCELAGEDKARKCNRRQRQGDSLGRIQCCTRCESTGEMLNCVEQVEIRADNRYGHIEEKDWGEIIVFNQWHKEERALRDVGLVWWTPINLEWGDTDRKRMMIEQWEQRDRPQPALPKEDIDSGKAHWHKEKVVEQEFTDRMQVCLQMNQELVAEWDEEDLNLEPRLLLRQAEEDDTKARNVRRLMISSQR